MSNSLPLTIYGFRFGAQDKHIIDAIAKSAAPELEVILFSGSSPTSQQIIKERARRLASSIRLAGGASAFAKFVRSDKITIWR
jgi:hypothetical protein